MSTGTAIIVGVGPGLGLALARAFTAEGHPTALLARDADRLADHVAELSERDVTVRGYAAGAANPDSLRAALTTAVAELGAPEVLIYNAALLRADTPTDGDHVGWSNALAVNVLGAKVAAETILPTLQPGRGSLLFTGGGLALAPSPEYASISVGKAALRAYVTALNAQQQGSGVHVTSVTIVGNIDGNDPRFAAGAIAQTYLNLHHQAAEDWKDELLPNKEEQGGSGSQRPLPAHSPARRGQPLSVRGRACYSDRAAPLHPRASRLRRRELGSNSAIDGVLYLPAFAAMA